MQIAKFKQHIRVGHVTTFMLEDPKAVNLEQGIVLDQPLQHFLNASFAAETSVKKVIDNAKHMPLPAQPTQDVRHVMTMAIMRRPF